MSVGKVRLQRRSGMVVTLAGMATITLDQKLSARNLGSDKEALASDWRAVGDDMRRVMSRRDREYEAA